MMEQFFIMFKKPNKFSYEYNLFTYLFKNFNQAILINHKIIFFFLEFRINKLFSVKNFNN